VAIASGKITANLAATLKVRSWIQTFSVERLFVSTDIFLFLTSRVEKYHGLCSGVGAF
jgi:hypothetical protein